MNRKTIINNLSKIVMVEVLLMIPPMLISFAYGEIKDALSFLMVILPILVISYILGKVVKGDKLGPRDGYVIVASAWIIISLIGAVPLFLSGAFNSYIGAFFEIVSGFTTTGASVMADPGVLGHGMQFFRCFSHWVGGMGVLVFVLMIMPLENDSSMHLVRAEVPGPTAGKIVPKMSQTSRILYGIYAGITLLLAIILIILGMPIYDAFCYAFGTAGTGGFSITAAGISAYNSPAIEIVISIFMLACGVNFNVYYLILMGKAKDALKTEELKVYLGIVISSVLIVGVNIYKMIGNVFDTFRLSLFQVSSIITTTGFATADYNLWPQLSQHLLVFLMIIGGCAGSTAGGMKVSRVIILWKSFLAEIRSVMNPKQVISVRVNSEVVSQRTLQSSRIYAAAYLIIICISTLLLSANGFDFTTNVTAVLACFNNIGPGLNLVGPAANFGIYNDFSKFVLAIVMLTGRLEIFPMFLLFAKSAHEK